MERGRVVEEGKVYDIFSNPKQAITRRFVNSTSSLSKVDELVRKDSPLVKSGEGESRLYRLVFDKKVNSPVISEVSRKFGVDFNIILANVEVIGDETIGAMIVKIIGDDKAIDAALTYLSATKVRVEAV